MLKLTPFLFVTMPPASESNPAAVMAEAARNFLAALEPAQQEKATFPFETEERMNWHFIPRARKGLPFKELDGTQRHLAHAFLSAGLSQRGYLKATTIMSLEEVLRVLEEGKGPVRDPDLYYFSIFGRPSADAAWGWRVEGHHVSVNITVVQGRLIASTPQFLGANPAEVRQGPRKGLRVLHAEEDLGRQLLHSMDSEQRPHVVIDETAPRDIITGASRKAEIGAPKGLPASRMKSDQRQLLLALLDEYARAMPAEIADERLEKLRKAGLDHVHFAWAGSAESGQPHYYRVQGPTFLIEYDNTQNEANHIHSVWRDFDGDWGLDLLRMHYDAAPHPH
jgi:hypothetical protein